MQTNRLQSRIIRVSAITIVIALFIGLILHVFKVADPIAEQSAGSISGVKTLLATKRNLLNQASSKAGVNIGETAGNHDTGGSEDEVKAKSTNKPNSPNNKDNAASKVDTKNTDGAEKLPENSSPEIKEPLPYFASGGVYTPTDPQEIELLKKYPEVVDMTFSGDDYSYNPLEQWRYDKIMEQSASVPETMKSLLERRPQSVHFVYKYLDFVNHPENYTSNAKSNKTNFEESKYFSKYPYYSNWDSTWGYMNYSHGQLVNSGCGPVNFAMLVAGMNQDETMTPDKALQFAREHHYEDPRGNGSLWDLFAKGVNEFGIQSETLDRNKPEEILKALADGKPVIMMVNHPEFTSVGHFILLYGAEGDMVKVQDSNSVRNSNRMWKLTELLSQTSAVWSFHK